MRRARDEISSSKLYIPPKNEWENAESPEKLSH